MARSIYARMAQSRMDREHKALLEEREERGARGVPPKLTRSERQLGLARAMAARKARAACKARMKAGEVTLADALDEPIMRRALVRHALESLPGIGPAKAGRAMRELGLPDGKRVAGLGCRQRERLLAWADKRGL